jgi:hypothetical protein
MVNQGSQKTILGLHFIVAASILFFWRNSGQGDKSPSKDFDFFGFYLIRS